jgi:pyruvate dehydrogenase E1 component alpha subunit
VPRETFQPGCRLERLSVLAHDGKLDKSLEPRIPDADLRRLYKTMLHTRMLDERCLHMQRQGRIGTYGPCKGQEATPLGIVYHLRKEDWLVPSYRELPAFIWRGWPMDRYMLWWGGHEIGSAVPEGINDLPICVPIASQCQYAAGIAWGARMRKNGQVVVCFVGDGGTSEGDFHEAMNFATVYKAPLVMVVQNNQWAISMPRRKQTASQTIAQKAVAYGIDGIEIDGNDILAALVAGKEAIEKARAGGGPTLVEAVTYRLAMHTTADDPKKYRTEEEVKQWEARDPLPRYRNYLVEKKLLDEKIEAVIKEEINKELDAAVAGYESYKLDRYEFFRHMYAEMTPELARQLAELRDYDAWRESASAVPERAVAH